MPRNASVMSFNQGEFNFEARPGEKGYQRWREELDARKRAFEARWGVILGRRVRLQLRDHLHPIEGIIRLREDKQPKNAKHPLLIINNLEFSAAHIDSLVALDD